MEPLLFLAHRIPFPPNKGDKIRSFHELEHLARDYSVHLGAFVDDPSDWQYRSALEELCEDVFLVELDPRTRKLASLAGLVTREPLSLRYYRSEPMRAWVREKIVTEGVNRVLAFSSPMAQFVRGFKNHGLHRIVDLVDADSEKWRQYATRQPWPMSWLYRREGETLLDFERAVAAELDATIFVTEDEAEVFRRRAPETNGRVLCMNNGVDADYFSPVRSYEKPYAPENKVLVFTGAMDYWANVDAVTWFANEVFPEIQASVPEACFFVVGARPTRAVRRLGSLPGVEVTGAVPDTRPYLAHARSAVAPLRIARGIQNKVLEAMAMAKPVLATPAAVEGLELAPRGESFISQDKGVLAALGVRLLRAEAGEISGLGAEARRQVLSRYDWKVHLRILDELLGTTQARK